MSPAALKLMVVAIMYLFSTSSDAFDSTTAGLAGCWRDYAEMEGVERIILSGGYEGASWGANPETGEEIVGMWPYRELCFEEDGALHAVSVGIDEGRDTRGSFELRGTSLFVQNDNSNDPWPFPADHARWACSLFGYRPEPRAPSLRQRQ
jgi:hypothetical protein